MAKRFVGWDFAGSESKYADRTAFVKICVVRPDLVVIEDYGFYRYDTSKVEKLLVAKAQQFGIRTKHILSVDPGQAGKAQQMYLSRLLTGYHYEFVRDNRSKLERALPVSAACLNGHIKIVKNKFYNEFVEELESITEDPKDYAHDDGLDALSSAYNATLVRPVKFRTLHGYEPKVYKFGLHNNKEDDWLK